MVQFGAFIVALFMYVGAHYMFGNIVSGTTVTDGIVRTYVPIILGGAVLAILLGSFTRG